MKKNIAVAVVPCIILFACVKNTSTITSASTACTNVTQASEQQQILDFLATDSILFTKDTSGVYYHIDTAGTGQAATANSTVTFTYSAWLLNGTVLGYAATPIAYPLVNTIPGFVSMAGYFRTGTHIRLIIPSSLAYGCTGLSSGTTEIVPPNAILYYDLTITAIQ